MATRKTVRAAIVKEFRKARSQGGVLQRACLEALEPRVLLSAATLLHPAVAYTTGMGPDAVAVGDFNGDGKMDFVTVNASSNVNPGTLSLLLGKGDGTFYDAVTVSTDIDPSAVVVGRFNNDGSDDIAVACYDSGSGGSVSVVDIYLGNGDGTFQDKAVLAVPSNPKSIAKADFNGDGYDDLAVSSEEGNLDQNLTILLANGNGDGSFSVKNTYTSYTGEGVTAADFDGDGKIDLAVVNQANSLHQNSYSVRVFKGQGDGTFAFNGSSPVGDGATGIAAADFNNDGHPDLAVTCYNDSKLNILLGAGDGTFGAHVDSDSGVAPQGVAVSDFDNDGFADPVMASTSGDTVRIKLGNGTGGFRAIGTEEISAGAGAYSVAIADFNGDRLQDVVAADEQGSSASVLLGAGPTAADLGFMISRNSTFTFTQKIFTNVYSDSNQLALAQLKIAKLPVHGTLKFHGNAVTAGQMIPAAQLGSLSYTVNTGYDGADSFDWRAFDGDVYSGLFTAKFVTNPEATIVAGNAVHEGQPGAPSNFWVELNHAAVSDVVINLTTAGHAAGGKNFVKLPAKVTIAAGATSAAIALVPLDDGKFTGDLDVIEKLAGGTGYTIGTAGSATTMIIDSAPVLSVVATDASAAETAAGQTADTGTFTIYRKTTAGTAATNGAVTVNFTLGGTTKIGLAGDYILKVDSAVLSATLTKSVVIPAGLDHVDVRLNPIDDALTELPETAVLTLAPNAAYGLSANLTERKATVSIADNEPVVSIAATDAAASETLPGQALDPGTFTIYRKSLAGVAVSAGDLTVKLTVSGSAKRGGDYALSVGGVALTTNTVVIPNGQDHVDVRLSPVDDGLTESAETAVLTLAKSTAYWMPAAAADGKATVAIADDTPTITAAVNDAVGSQAGSDPAVFRLTRSGYSGNEVTVTIKLAGTAKNGVDYNTVPVTATFAAGSATADVVITPKIDATTPKPTLTVLLNVKSGAGYKVGTTATLTASLEDNLALADFFPTAMGTWWHYTGVIGSKTLDAYRRMNENLTINGLLTTKLETDAAGKAIGADYFIVNGDGLSFVRSTYSLASGSETQTYDTPLLTMPARFRLGSTATGQATYSGTRTTGGTWTGTETRTMTVGKSAQKVTVPYQIYNNAIEVTLVDTWVDADGWHGKTTKDYWLVQGVGVVKMAVTATTADGQNKNAASATYSASMVGWST